MPSRTKPVLWIATRNRGKTREFARLLHGVCRVRDLHGLPEFPEIRETGKTFAANARLKARALSLVLRDRPILADDSGLVVPDLAGRPGVYSARFSGPKATDQSNRTKLLRLLGTRPGSSRKAYFEACLVISKNGDVLATVFGRVWGRILTQEAGNRGFGYDPIFQPKGFAKSFGQLPPGIKHRISHRARAVDKLRLIFSRLLKNS